MPEWWTRPAPAHPGPWAPRGHTCFWVCTGRAGSGPAFADSPTRTLTHCAPTLGSGVMQTVLSAGGGTGWPGWAR